MTLTILLEISDLHHPHGLHGISLTLAAGEAVALVGSQGNGKAPLLQLLTGVGRPSRGHLRICGHAPGSPAASARLGVAGPAWGLNPAHTVSETLALYASLWSLPPERAAEAVASLELTALRNRLVADLTPGEAARLRLARALLHDPALLVLDEPMGDVDLESAEIIEGAISAAADRGMGVLITTFGHPRTLRVASRIHYLENGRFVEPQPMAHAEPGEPGSRPGAPGSPTADARHAQPRVEQIAARRDERVMLFSPDEILYAYAQEKSVYLHTREGDWTASFTLSELEERLAVHGFYRAHRGYLVNLAHVREIAAWTRSSFSLRLKDGSEVPLSKHRVAELKALLRW
ncbi:LytTR family transcriptional regulator DNA-binding domain-containing protein [Symbiobacterium terraclitae]|jgi:ABC-type glutathione transport system ATPase component|uniref:LytTR family transcriptional regulator DNA-binding domain-containing protein n=1 Tax=Symbiobacterium terraclitae TaxID=557451 RepID=UPI0035B51F01